MAALQLSAGNASILVFGFGILFVFLVHSAQYESDVKPVIILMSLPLAMLNTLVFLPLVLSLGVVPPFYVVVKGLEERFAGPMIPDTAGSQAGAEPGA